MNVISLIYFIFIAVTVAVYYLIPKKLRPLVLLAASYGFYLSAKPIYGVFLVGITAITYLSGRCINRISSQKMRKRIMLSTVILCLFTLGVLKYTGFALESIGALAGFLGKSVETRSLNILLPVGISFYLFQAISYVIDVYREDISAEKNIIRYATYISFFPTILSGPIERAGHLIPQLGDTQSSSILDNLRIGGLRMLWGYFLKLVVADRIAVLVDGIYGSPQGYEGGILFLAAVLYSFQIYCDFAGYSNIAIGSARLFGIRLFENFESPYLSTSVAGFWRRWHKSLSFWFRDYVYIPLGGNRKGKGRKYLNLMIVFLLSGLWHGANWTFVVWGGLHGLFQILGDVLRPARDRIIEVLCIDRTRHVHKAFKTVVTFLLVTIAWVFFRSPNFGTAFYVVKNMWKITPWVLTDGSLLELGITGAEWTLLLLSLLLVIAVDIAHAHHNSLIDRILAQHLLIRWPLIIGGIILVLIYGMWGSAYSSGSFIYYQF